MCNRSAPAAIVFLLLLALALFGWGLRGCIDAEPLPVPGVFPDGSTGQENESEPTPDRLAVHFIDVGQGDAIFIQTPTRNILIDGGERDSAAANYLQSLGVRGLDLVVGTHPHSDHIGGLINVLQLLPVKEIIDPGVVHSTKTFEDYLILIGENEIKYTVGRAGMIREFGDGSAMEILHPPSSSFSKLNDASIVVRLTFGRISFLLAGDAENAAEKEILGRGCTLTSTILKVGHHGSRASSSLAFLEAVKPEVAVIMCGDENSYGYPHEEVLGRLARTGTDFYRTDRQGTIIVETDGKTYRVNKYPFGGDEG